MSFRFGTIGFALFVCSLSVNAAFATTYYVAASNGNDSNSCSAAQNISTPKRTINAGVNCMAGGDTLNVRAGTYNEALNNNTIPTGTGFPTGATTIQGYPGDAAPVMMGNVWISVKNNIVWKGVNINMINVPPPNSDNGAEAWTGFFINGGTNILVTQSEISYCSKNCILTHDGNAPLSNITFSYNKVHHAAYGCWISAAEPGGHNFYISAHYTTTGPIIVDHNESYGATCAPNDWGIQVYSYNPGFLNGVVVSNNYVHDNNQGIVVGSGPNHKVFNNVVYNNDSAKSYGEAAITVGYGTGMNNIQVYNNTIVGNRNGAYGISVGTYGAPTNTIIQNNILWQNGVDSIKLAGGTGTVTSNNWMGVDPLFANPSSLDFHLQSGSGARNTGLNLDSIFTTDKDGNLRPVSGSWDPGSYMVVTSSTGSAPAAPQNLHLLN